MPMEREAKKDWSWVDWMRFLFYRQAVLGHALHALSRHWNVVWCLQSDKLEFNARIQQVHALPSMSR